MEGKKIKPLIVKRSRSKMKYDNVNEIKNKSQQSQTPESHFMKTNMLMDDSGTYE